MGWNLKSVLVAAGAALCAFALGSVAGAASAAGPSNTSLPTITGTAQTGSKLTAQPGTWSGSGSISYAFQWQRCDKGGQNCVVLKEKSATYTLGPHDVGTTLRVKVTATNAQGSATAKSAPTALITSPGAAGAPKNTAAPSISGTPQQGATLTANAGTWQGTSPIALSYRWQRCTGGGGQCNDLKETSRTYHVGSNDVGKTIRVVVTAKNAAGSSSAVSPAVGPMTAAGPQPTQCAQVASVSLPTRLIVDRIQFAPARIASFTQPLVARFHVSSTKSGCVAGALVYAIGVPFDRLSTAPEASTDSTGWATMTFRVRPTFRLRRGSFVVVFVRARKPGDNLLAGVSTRRLVSVRVG